MGFLGFLLGSAIDGSNGKDSTLDGGILGSIIENALTSDDTDKK